MPVNRVTLSEYVSGFRVNYFNMNLNMILTKHQNCSKVRGITTNTYVIGVL